MKQKVHICFHENNSIYPSVTKKYLPGTTLNKSNKEKDSINVDNKIDISLNRIMTLCLMFRTIRNLVLLNMLKSKYLNQ